MDFREVSHIPSSSTASGNALASQYIDVVDRYRTTSPLVLSAALLHDMSRKPGPFAYFAGAGQDDLLGHPMAYVHQAKFSCPQRFKLRLLFIPWLRQ